MLSFISMMGVNLRFIYFKKVNKSMPLNLRKITNYLSLVIIITAFQACVPARQFEDLQSREKKCQDEALSLRNENQDLKTENTELKSSSSEKQKDLIQLKKDTAELGEENRRINRLNDELTKSYDKLIFNNEKLLAGNTEEMKNLIIKLDRAKEDLQRKEDEIKKDSIALNERENKLKELKIHVDELESILRRTDSTVNKLKTTVSDALTGYEGNGLSVYQKEGRVYVSMEERLLFASGSTTIEKNGESALKDLSKVLATNKNINVLVEGHTDNVPISGTLSSGAKDNWELSVLRATAVSKIILSNTGIEPVRITAAGRGSYKPIDPANTSEARKKNRRTEIILTPKLDELVKLLDEMGKEN
jgi:chemotaxis protein MotB